MCDLLVDDPAVYVVREIDVAAVKVTRDERGNWFADGSERGERSATADAIRPQDATMLLRYLAQSEAIARAIEANEETNAVDEGSDIRYPEIEVELLGRGSNAGAIMGSVAQALRAASVPNTEVMEYRRQAMSGDYNNLIQVSMAWVQVY